jgi:hypothetical protein
MTGYTVLAGALIFFGLFIYLTWFGTSIKMESQKEEIIIYADSLYSSIVGQEQNRFLSP